MYCPKGVLFVTMCTRSSGLGEVEDGADVHVDEAPQTQLHSGEQRSSGDEFVSAAVDPGSIGTNSERMMDSATTTGAHRMGATASTLKFRGAASQEGFSS